MKVKVRGIIKEDIIYLKEVLNSIELFPTEMLDDMILDFLTNTDSKDIWFTAVHNEIPIGLGYCAPEMLAEGTFNLYAIGVKAELQGNGIGSQMMRYIEAHLKANGQRILIVETSDSKDFKLTRSFYQNLNYIREAVIRDFWSDGDNKVIFWKKLN